MIKLVTYLPESDEVLERIFEWSIVGGAQAEVLVPGEAFGVLAGAALRAESCRQVAHGFEVGVHALGLVEPFFLAAVGSQRRTLALDDRVDADVKFRVDS